MASTSLPFRFRGDVLAELVDSQGRLINKWELRNSTADNMKTAVARALAGAPSGTLSYIGASSGVSSSYTVYNEDISLGTATAIAAPITQPANAYPNTPVAAATIFLALRKVGTPGGNLTVSLYNGSTVPATLVSSAPPISLNSLTTSYQYIPFQFLPSSGVWPTAQWIVVTTDAGYVFGANQVYLQGAGSVSNNLLTTAIPFTTWTAYGGLFNSVLDYQLVPPVYSGSPAQIELARVPVSAKSNPQATTVRLFGSFGATQAVGQLGQLALWDSAVGGNLCALTACNIIKGTGEYLNVYWNVTLL